MINVNNSQANNVFKDFPELKFGQPSVNVNSNLLTNKPDSVSIKKGTDDSQKLASVKVSDIQNKKGKKGGLVAATVGTTILTAGIIALVFTKGFSSVTYRKINGLIDSLNDKIYDSTISKKSKTYLEKADLALVKGFKSFLSGLKSVANLNAIKDSFADRVFRSTKFTTKIADGITNTFKKFSYDSIDSAYNKVHIGTDDVCAKLSNQVSKIKANKNIDLTQEVDIKGVKKPLSEWLIDLEQHSDKMKSTFETGFSKQSRLARDEVRQDELKDLPNHVWNRLYHENGGILNFKENIDKFKSYITEDLSMPGKIKLRKEISSSRRIFTNNVFHNYSMVKTSLQEVSENLFIDDKASRSLLRSISKKMEVYRTLSGKDELVNRSKIVKELFDDLTDFNNLINTSDKYTDTVKEAVNFNVKFITEDVLKTDKKGCIQEIMTIVKGLSSETAKNAKGEAFKIFDERLASTLDTNTSSITKRINKATTMESEDLYDKCAEFKVGSAPNDVLGLIFPVGVAAYAISKGDDKNERISTTLTTGIPIIGGIGSMIYGTTRMLAGPKNFGLAAAVGFVLNFVGNGCDKLYKEYQEKRSFTQMAVDAYKNNTLFTPINNNKNI